MKMEQIKDVVKATIGSKIKKIHLYKECTLLELDGGLAIVEENAKGCIKIGAFFTKVVYDGNEYEFHFSEFAD